MNPQGFPGQCVSPWKTFIVKYLLIAVPEVGTLGLLNSFAILFSVIICRGLTEEGRDLFCKSGAPHANTIMRRSLLPPLSISHGASELLGSSMWGGVWVPVMGQTQAQGKGLWLLGTGGHPHPKVLVGPGGGSAAARSLWGHRNQHSGLLFQIPFPK